MHHVKEHNRKFVKQVWSNSRNYWSVGSVPPTSLPFILSHCRVGLYYFPRRLVLIAVTWTASCIPNLLLPASQI